VLVLLLPVSARATASDVNTIKSNKTGQAGIEIELNSTRPSPVRSQIAVLRIGSKEFTRSG
jgi:hypothetical protein